MELKEATKILSEYRTGSYEALKDIPKVYRAIDTVLYQLGILKKENDTLWEENIKLKQLNIAYKLRINDFAIDIHKAHAEGYEECKEELSRLTQDINDLYAKEETACKYLAIERAGYLRGYADGCKRVKDEEEVE